MYRSAIRVFTQIISSKLRNLSLFTSNKYIESIIDVAYVSYRLLAEVSLGHFKFTGGSMDVALFYTLLYLHLVA